MYDTRAAAEVAKQRLSQAGVSAVDVHDQGSVSDAEPAGGLIAEIRGVFDMHDDAHGYAEGLRRGHVLLTAEVDDSKADETIRVLEGSGAVDFDEKQKEWRGAGWTPALSAADRVGDDNIELVEENLVVGKREVDRGGVRVRSYIVETPVQESVSLRDERVDVERRALSRPVTAGDDAFRDRTVEMRATGEEAVVGKQTVVKEELAIKKDVGQRTEEIRDTVRHTEVEVGRSKGEASTGAAIPRKSI